MTSRKAKERDRRNNERMVKEAREQLKEGRPDRARRLLMAVISNYNGNARYWLELGRLEQGEGNAQEAARAYGRALDLSPDFGTAQRALDALGVPRPEPHVEFEDDDSEAPADLSRTAGVDWDAVTETVTKFGGVALPGHFDVELAGALDAALAGQPGRPLEEDGASEHLLSSAPDGLAPWMPEWTYRGRQLNRALRGLLSGPMPPAGDRIIGALSVVSVDAGALEVRWPRATGESSFPIELLLPLSGTLLLEVSDAVGGKKGKLRRPIEAAVGDGLVLSAGERAVHIGGVWGRQGLIVRVIGEACVLRVRIG
ncbi:MAG: hypothetical protein O2816_16010 [Planctomycetota bacterium]|nr:hypothetical protein [Planctomycetota bacterium]